MLATLGVTDAAGSIVFGRVSDRVGRLPLLLLGALCQTAAYIVLFIFDSLNNLAVLMPVACLLGFGDAAFNTQISGILGFLFRDSSASAFANFKLFQSLATGILFFISDVTTGASRSCALETCPNMNVWMPVLLGGLAAGVAGVLVLRAKRIPIDARSRSVYEGIAVD